MQKFIQSFFIGIGYAIFSMTMSLILSGVEEVTVHAVLVVMIAGGIIGLYTIYMMDYLDLNLWLLFLMHFVISFGVISIMMMAAGYMTVSEVFSLQTFSIYSINYLIIWVIVTYSNQVKVKWINQRLKERNNER